MPKAKYQSEVSRLCSAIQSSRKVDQRGRTQHMEAARLYAGDQWSTETAIEKTYVNFISLYVDIILRQIVSKSPRLMLSTFDRMHKPAVQTLQTWSNDEFDRMNFAGIMKRIALNALISGGFCKVSLATPAEAARGAWNVGPGKPCIQHIDRDDMVWDCHARDFEELDFIGHRYRAPIAAVRDSVLYDKSRKDLVASTDGRFNAQGDERINVLGRGYWGNDEEYEDKVDIWEIFCPRERMVYTLSEDALTGATAPSHGGEPCALREQEWVGHETGPFKMLALGTVPGNAAPKGPVMNLINLSRAMNRILGKLIWSAINYKDVLIAPKGNDGDIERTRTSMHGDILGLDRPKDFAQVSMNVPNNMIMQFFDMLKNLFSWMAGNLDILGGLSPQAKTATQDKMANQNATGGVADMQDRMLTFTSDVARSFLWYPWHDPNLIMKANYSPQGLPDIQVERQLHPWNSPDPRVMKRSGNWEDIHCKIDPYSTPHSTPQQRAADLIGLVKEVWTPLAGLAAQQGKVLDFGMFLEKVGLYKDMPDLPEIMTAHEPPEPQGGGGPPQAGPRPAPEQTEHIRTNMPGRTERGDMMNRMNAMSGIDTGGAQRNGQLQPQGAM